MDYIVTFVVLFLLLTKISVFCEKNEDFSSVFDEKGDLLFVQLIFRHGDRTPIRFYKNDPWSDQKYWEVELGQLTTLGKQQQFELGIWLRDRYSKLLNDTYSDRHIYVQSSDIDRAIMSAEAVMAGMYKPKNKEIWNFNLPWQPIPVHTVPRQEDYFILGEKACKASEKYLQELLHEINNTHQHLFDYLALHSGEVVGRGLTVSIRDTLTIEATYNKSLPVWTKKIFPGGDLYNSIEEVILSTFKLDTSTPQLAKIKGGFLLKDILDRFTNKSMSKLDPDRSMWVYSGHDTTICRILNTLGLLQSMPPYSSCVMFEMRKINDVPHIEIFFKNSSATPEQFYIPKCGVSCPLTNLYVLYKDVLPTKSYEDECIISKAVRCCAPGILMQVLPGISSVLLTKLLHSEYW